MTPTSFHFTSVREFIRRLRVSSLPWYVLLSPVLVAGLSAAAEILFVGLVYAASEVVFRGAETAARVGQSPFLTRLGVVDVGQIFVGNRIWFFLAGAYFLRTIANFLAHAYPVFCVKRLVHFARVDIAERSFRSGNGEPVHAANWLAAAESAGEQLNTLLQLAVTSLVFVIQTLFLFVMSWQVTLIALLFFCVTAGLTNRLTRKSIKRGRLVFQLADRLNVEFHRGLERASRLRNLTLSELEIGRIRALSERLGNLRMKYLLSQRLIGPLHETLYFGLLIALIVVTWQVCSRGQCQFFATGTAYFILASRAQLSISRIMSLKLTLLSVNEYFGGLSLLRPKQAPRESGFSPVGPLTPVVVENLSFQYQPGVPVIANLSFRLSSAPSGGGLTLIRGPSGAGKTTLLRLLVGELTPTAGRIRFGEFLSEGQPPAFFRESISYLPQETYLLRGTLRSNLLYGLSPHLGNEWLEKVLRQVGLEEWFRQLPDGWFTPLGGRSSFLSGGQRQRLALARALLKPAPILVVDEPTAGLDDQAAREIVTLFDSLRRHKTLVVASHFTGFQSIADASLPLEAPPRFSVAA